MSPPKLRTKNEKDTYLPNIEVGEVRDIINDVMRKEVRERKNVRENNAKVKEGMSILKLNFS